jgi:hypothetical protein
MPSIVDDFKAIHEAAMLLEGGDDHYGVAQPMAVNTEGMTLREALDAFAGQAAPIEGELLSHICSDGHAWNYDSSENEWFTVNEWGVKSTSFTRPA